MKYRQEIKIKLKLLVKGILASETKNFEYFIKLSSDDLQFKYGSFDTNWEGKASFLINPTSAIMLNTKVQYSIIYIVNGKSCVIATGDVSLKDAIDLSIEVKFKNTKGTIKDNGATKEQYISKESQDSEQCKHTDGAILVAEYIVNEIKQNVKSETAQKIRIDLEGFGFVDLGSAVVSPAFLLAQKLTSAILKWNAAVRSGAEWDHKPKIRDNPNFKKVAVHRPLESGTPSQSYYHKYKSHDYYYDVWSNIHYGYVGLSVGFPEWILSSGASKAQGMDGGGSEDPIDDDTCIHIGFALYKRFGKYAQELTAQDVLDALEECTDQKLPESRQTHWCWNNDNPSKVAGK